MKGAPASLIELLLFRAIDRFSEDAHHDEPIDGDLHAIDAMASTFTLDDDQYQADLAAIEESDADLRSKQYRQLGAIMRCLKRHGKMDSAPVAFDEESYDFLST